MSFHLIKELTFCQKHVEKGCVSGIPTGAGTENNERLFHQKSKWRRLCQQFYFMFTTAVLAMVTEEKLPFIALCLFKSHHRVVDEKVWIFLKMKRIPEQTQIISWKFAKVLCNCITPFYKAGENASDEGSGPNIYQRLYHFQRGQ